MVRIFNSFSGYKSWEKKIEKIAEDVLKILKKEKRYLEIYLVTDAQIRSLNKKFLKKDKATNILSFENPKGFPCPFTKEEPLGEIYLALDYIKKINLLCRIEANDIKLLIIHGILHLIGYNHKEKSGREKMEKKENTILKKI